MYFRSDDDVRACDDVRIELMPFIQSQYSASVKIVDILQSCKNHILPDADIDLFFDNVFNIQTAVGYGLDVWGDIVGISRNIQKVVRGTGEDVGKLIETSETIVLDDDSYRQLLFIKCASNIMDSTMYSLNYILLNLYPDLNCYVELESNWTTSGTYTYNQSPMEINYVFINHILDDTELSVFNVVGKFNRGAGVGWNLLEYQQDEIFGFRNSELQPFDQGVFFASSGGA